MLHQEIAPDIITGLHCVLQRQPQSQLLLTFAQIAPSNETSGGAVGTALFCLQPDLIFGILTRRQPAQPLGFDVSLQGRLQGRDDLIDRAASRDI